MKLDTAQKAADRAVGSGDGEDSVIISMVKAGPGMFAWEEEILATI